MKKEIKEKIKKVIKEMKLKEEKLNNITLGNMNKICEKANVKMIDLMYYLRYEK